jgi:hypothetical protein
MYFKGKRSSRREEMWSRRPEDSKEGDLRIAGKET